MKHEPLERLAAMRHHDQPAGLASSDECLLDRSAAGNQLLAIG
jgi:hypothetical protein